MSFASNDEIVNLCRKAASSLSLSSFVSQYSNVRLIEIYHFVYMMKRIKSTCQSHHSTLIVYRTMNFVHNHFRYSPSQHLDIFLLEGNTGVPACISERVLLKWH